MTVDLAVSTKTVDFLQPPGGAVVVGGDYQGLGIVRSLGRRKVPVCIIDDEFSISRFSKYATYAVSVGSLRDERRTVDAVLEIGHRLNLRGWVLYPTRDETVAAFARYRALLAKFFRVPTPGWETMQWVWDKRNTYQLANDLGIPTPRTWYPRNLQDLEEIRADPPLPSSPRLKSTFFMRRKPRLGVPTTAQS